MVDFQFPVFVRLKDCGDVRPYKSIADMQRDFEQIDVENNEYESWDARGTPLELSVQKPAEWLRVKPKGEPNAPQLAAAIAEFARRQSIQVDMSGIEHGDFSGVLGRVTSAILAKRKAEPWWRRFKRRF